MNICKYCGSTFHRTLNCQLRPKTNPGIQLLEIEKRGDFWQARAWTVKGIGTWGITLTANDNKVEIHGSWDWFLNRFEDGRMKLLEV